MREHYESLEPSGCDSWRTEVAAERWKFQRVTVEYSYCSEKFKTFCASLVLHRQIYPTPLSLQRA